MPLSPKCDVDLKFKASKYPGPDAQILTRNVSYQYYLVTPDKTFWLWQIYMSPPQPPPLKRLGNKKT